MDLVDPRVRTPQDAGSFARGSDPLSIDAWDTRDSIQESSEEFVNNLMDNFGADLEGIGDDDEVSTSNIMNDIDPLPPRASAAGDNQGGGSRLTVCIQPALPPNGATAKRLKVGSVEEFRRMTYGISQHAEVN